MVVMSKTPRRRVRRAGSSPYVVDEGRLRRYDQRDLIFNRVYNDPSWGGYGRREEERALENIRGRRGGYTRIDYALAEAISREPEPSWEPACRSNNPGATSTGVKTGWTAAPASPSAPTTQALGESHRGSSGGPQRRLATSEARRRPRRRASTMEAAAANLDRGVEPLLGEMYPARKTWPPLRRP